MAIALEANWASMLGALLSLGLGIGAMFGFIALGRRRRLRLRWPVLAFALLALVMGMAIAVPRAIGTTVAVFGADGLWCAPWPRAIPWSDVRRVSTRSTKNSGSQLGWTDVGIIVRVDRVPGTVDAPAPWPDAPAAWLRALIRLQSLNLAWLTEEMAPNDAYCELVDIDLDIETAKRTAQEMTWLHRAFPDPRYAGHRDGLLWCERVPRDDYWGCAKNAGAHHDRCRDDADYDTCRRRAIGDLIGG